MLYIILATEICNDAYTTFYLHAFRTVYNAGYIGAYGNFSMTRNKCAFPSVYSSGERYAPRPAYITGYIVVYSAYNSGYINA
jgi:hypothetical protein